MARFYIENFGCRATQADGAALERQFLERGLERAGTSRDAEIVVLNTCTVTESADKDARASIRKLQRGESGLPHSGDRLLRAAGAGRNWLRCQELHGWLVTRTSIRPRRSQPHRWVVFHRRQVLLLPMLGFVPLGQLSQPGNVVVGDIFAHTELLAAPVFEAANERTRPNLKVQDGCDNRCSFCVIPYVRGQSRSLPLERVIAEVGTLVESGYREVVISGINLGRWGKDLEEVDWSMVVSRWRARTITQNRTPNDQRLTTIDW